MILSFIQVASIVFLVILVIGIIFVTIALFRTILFKNPYIKAIKKPKLPSGKIDDYQKSLNTLITERLDKAMLELFPTAINKGKLVYFKSGLLYIYQNNEINVRNILIDIPVKSIEPNSLEFDEQYVIGDNTYRSKAELYSLMDSIETALIQNKEIKLNLKVLIYEKAQTNAEMIGYLFERGERFDIAVGEGGKILDPLSTNLTSYYSFLGVGVNEKVTYKFKTKKIGKGNLRLSSFIGTMLNEEIFKLRYDNELIKFATYVGKDMSFGNRFVINNIVWLPKLGEKLIDDEIKFISSAWKTYFVFDEVYSNDEECYVYCDFYLSNSETFEDVRNKLNDLLIKYGIEGELVTKLEKTRTTNIRNRMYRKFLDVVERSISDTYTSPYIINGEVSDRDLNKVSRCVVRFSPLYYPKEVLDGETEKEMVSYTSIDRGINFYEELIKEFSRYNG